MLVIGPAVAVAEAHAKEIHPTCIPKHGDFQSKLTLMSESLRNDGRIWVPKNIEDAKALQAGTKQGWEIPEEDRDYYLERRYPAPTPAF